MSKKRVNMTKNKKSIVKKAAKKFVPAVMAAVLAVTATVPVVAVGENNTKEEVIYVNLDAGGSVKDVYAVNIFGKGNITDYGDYSAVEMLNTMDKISQNGDIITFSTNADRVYYKGKMKSTEIPWNIYVKYYIDGREYSAKDAAGKSGNLEIRFKVTENENYNGSFYENYALQASFTLDTKKCSDIVAKGATLANVGSEKQISYTMLPGEGIDAVVTANVTDFEMSALSINGVPLSMNIEIDDEELMNQVTELIDAIKELDEGAGEIKNGAEKLQDASKNDLQTGVNDLVEGVSKLYSGAAELKEGGEALSGGTDSLKTGAEALNSGVKSLSAGIEALQSGLNELNSKSGSLTQGSSEMKNALLTIQKELNAVSAQTEQIDMLVSGSSQIKAGIDELSANVAKLQSNVSFSVYKAAMKENQLDIDELQAANAETIRTLNTQLENLKATRDALQGISGYETEVAELNANISQLEGIVTLIQGNNAAILGMEAYLTQLNASIGELAGGVDALKASYAKLDEGINVLAAEVKGLMLKMTELKSGIDMLVTEYEKLDKGINEYTGGVAQIVAGYSKIAAGTGELLSGSDDLKNGTAQLHSKTGELLSGIAQFYSGAGDLNSGTGELNSGVAELVNGIDELCSGTSELKDGTAQMCDETAGLDEKISDKIDEMIESITGSSSEVVSFVSEKNTNVKSVQFVIRTEAVEIEATETAAPATEEKLNFWQKILRLFGLY